MYLQKRSLIIGLIERLWGEKIMPSVGRQIERATDLAVQAQKDLLSVLMRAVPEGFEGLRDSFFNGSVRSVELIQSRYLNSIDLSSKVYRNQAFMTGKIDSIVNDGIILEKSAIEIADEVVQYVNPRTPGGARYAATRLGRTEINNAAHTTTLRQYAESPWVEGVLWSLSGSHKESDDCDEFATQNDFGLGRGVWPKDQVPFKPHPQCFCYITPITIEPEQFFSTFLIPA
jgi:hypothetical protein